MGYVDEEQKRIPILQLRKNTKAIRHAYWVVSTHKCSKNWRRKQSKEQERERQKKQLRTKKILHVFCIIPIEIAHWTVINKWFGCVRVRTRSHKWSWNFLLLSACNAHLLHWNAVVVSANQFDHFNTNIFVVLTLHVRDFSCTLFRSLQSASHHRYLHWIYRYNDANTIDGIVSPCL